jgi:hypothetical protein
MVISGQIPSMSGILARLDAALRALTPPHGILTPPHGICRHKVSGALDTSWESIKGALVAYFPHFLFVFSSSSLSPSPASCSPNQVRHHIIDLSLCQQRANQASNQVLLSLLLVGWSITPQFQATHGVPPAPMMGELAKHAQIWIFEFKWFHGMHSMILKQHGPWHT